MDLSKLFQYFNSKEYSDCTLELICDGYVRKIYVHRIILAMSSPYFHVYFSKETQDSIQVEDLAVAYNIFADIYRANKEPTGYSESKEFLLECQIKDLFMMDIDKSKLLSLRIQPEEFVLYVKVCNILGFSKDIIDTIRKKIPDDFDLNILSDELLREIYSALIEENIYLVTHSGIYNMGDTEIVKFYIACNQCLYRNGSFYELNRTSITKHDKDGDNILCAGNRNIDILSGYWIKFFEVSKDGSVVAYFDSGQCLAISYMNVINSTKIHKNVSALAISNDNKTVAWVVGDEIYFYDIVSNKQVNKIKIPDPMINNLYFLDNDQTLAYHSGKYVKIINLLGKEIWSYSHDGNVTLRVNIDVFNINVTAFANYGKYIFSGDINGIVKIYDLETHELLNTIKCHENSISGIFYSTYDNKIITSSMLGEDVSSWDIFSGANIETHKIDNYLQIFYDQQIKDPELFFRIKNIIEKIDYSNS